MIIREVLPEEKEKYNLVVNHPLQSWEWGEFRQKTGLKIIRLGEFKKKDLIRAYQLTIHSLPKTSFTIGYLPKGSKPDRTMIKTLKDVGKENNCLFIKLEPNKVKNPQTPQIPQLPNLLPSPKPLFTKYTFQIDLTQSEEELLRNMKPKTRYNVRLAQKKGVTISEDNSDQAFKTYLKLLKETTQRQNFYAHDENYHRLMWETLEPAGTAKLLKAQYQGKPLVIWILFHWHDTLYYPYGASSNQHKEVMASNLIMWEAIRFGQKLGCQVFDLWGCLGPDPDKKDPWYGFHRFKEGYGPKLIEFIGSYDLVFHSHLYQLYNLADSLRWKFLRLRR